MWHNASGFLFTLKTYTIRNPIKRLPDGMELNRRLYYIAAPKNLDAKVFRQFKDPAERLGAMRIPSMISFFQKKYHDGNNAFANISKNVLCSCAGNNYRRIIDWLIAIDVIEVNEIYSKGDDGKAFCKSYRFAPHILASDFVLTKWDTSKVEPTDEEIEKTIGETIFTPNGEHDAELLYCLQHERLLSIPNPDEAIAKLIEEDRQADDICYLDEWFYRINSNKYLPSPQDKSSRFYFNSVLMPTCGRRFLRYENKSRLINYDIQTAYPAFIKMLCSAASGTGDNKEEGVYRTIVKSIFIGKVSIILDDFYRKDFYSDLIIGTSYKSRGEAKQPFNSYRNHKSKEYRRNHIFTKRLIEMGEPEMAKFITETDQTWDILEEIETNLLCSICNRCMDLDLVFIRQHDGFLTIPEHKQAVDAILQEYPHNIFKYKQETYE